MSNGNAFLDNVLYYARIAVLGAANRDHEADLDLGKNPLDLPPTRAVRAGVYALALGMSEERAVRIFGNSTENSKQLARAMGSQLVDGAIAAAKTAAAMYLPQEPAPEKTCKAVPAREYLGNPALLDDSIVCSNCGRRLSPHPFVKINDRYCANCGSFIELAAST